MKQRRGNARVGNARGDERRNRAEELLLHIAAAEPGRVAPACRHFGVCGGCQLQDLSQEKQLLAKKTMLVQLLREAGIPDAPAVEVHAAGEYGYRNRARMRVEAGEIGYNRRASHAFLPIAECPIVTPRIWQAAEALRHLVKVGSARWPEGTVSFELFASGDEAALQLSLHVAATVNTVDRDAPRDLRVLCDALQSAMPQLVGAGLLVDAPPDPALPRRVQETQRVEIARWGEPHLHYHVGGDRYTITRNAFFQVNRFLTETMRSLVLDDRTGGVAYDLYAGAGLFSVPLTERFDRVVAVEIGEPAASDLAAHLRSAGPQHRAVRSTTLAFLEEQNSKGAAPPDLVVLDPPRAGLGPATVRALLRCGPRTMVYVSCDAGTFTADARALIESGYTLAALHLLDLFPQTFHTETIAVFQR